MSGEEKSGSMSLSSVPFILFVLNCIIVANTNKEDFGLVIDGGADWWSFHLTMMIASICMVVCILVWVWVAGVSTMSKNEGCVILTNVLGGVMGLGLLVLIGVQYWKMGVLWDRDPHHTILFYPEFWKEGVTHFGTVVGNPTRQLINSGKVSEVVSNARRLTEFTGRHWPYIMSDVVVRIYGFSMMILPVLMALILCCVGSGLACSRIFGSN